jgi:iron complex outermembrane recepter protein
MKLNRKKLSLAVVQALNAGVVVSLAAPLANAQPAPTTATPPVQKIGDRIEVTGSRIPSLTLESTSPVSVIDAQNIKWDGTSSTENVINRLPQAFADQGNNLSNGSSGTANINLRNLGSSRTLVLIDSKRLPAGSPTVGGYPTDINTIPAPLIKRVEVLTGGASAVYGSDAVAGVVNFIMNDSFEGLQFSYNGQWYNHQQTDGQVSSIVSQRAVTNPSQFVVPGNVSADGYIQDYSMILGSNFANGKGNATVFFEYRHVNAVTQATRDFSACTLGSNANGFTCGGSGTAYPGQFVNLNTGAAYTIANAAGGVRPYVSATDQFNFAPYNYYQRPDERYQANAFAHYDVFPQVRVYTEFDFSDDNTTSQIAPSGIFAGITIPPLLDNNPLLSQQFKTAFGITPTTPGDALIGRRNIEGGGRQENLRHTDYRFVIGAKGDFLDHAWDYDFWWQSGKVVYQETYLNDLSKARITKALQVVTDPATGQPACASVLDGTDPNCVPYNIFATGGVTPAALNYLQTPGFQNGSTQQSVIGLTVSSDLGAAYGWKLPLAKNGVGVALGFEHRTDKLNLNTDEFFQTFDGAGQGGPILPVSGQVRVNEFYGELRVPIMEGQPWADLLSVNGSYRYSDYSINQTTNSYGLGAEWAPVKQARLRGSYQQAVRAPNIIELFTAQGFNLFGFSTDPCGTSAAQPTPTATLAQCQATGLAANKYGSTLLVNPAGQGNYLQGGNPNLSPEKSNSYTVGVVLQPTKNFSATLDYWNIKVNDVIGIVPPDLILSSCIGSGALCNQIHRDSQGTLWLSGGGYISSLNLNLGSLKTTGYDVTANWNVPFDNYGSLGLSFIGTYVDQFIVQPLAGGPSYDCAGLFGITCGAAAGTVGWTPRWRSTLRGIWATPWNWDFALTWRYISSVSNEGLSGNPALNAPVNSVDRELATRSYWDIAASWNIYKGWTLRGGVNNVFDINPPVVNNATLPLTFGNGNTLPGVYDTLGRTLFLNVTAKF